MKNLILNSSYMNFKYGSETGFNLVEIYCIRKKKNLLALHSKPWMSNFRMNVFTSVYMLSKRNIIYIKKLPRPLPSKDAENAPNKDYNSIK